MSGETHYSNTYGSVEKILKGKDNTNCNPQNPFGPFLVVSFCTTTIKKFFGNHDLVRQQAQLQGLTTGSDNNGMFITIPREMGFVVEGETDCFLIFKYLI